MENFETEVLKTLTLMDADSLACACGILGWVLPVLKKDNLKLLSKDISRHFNSEHVESSDVGGLFWYRKLTNHLEIYQKGKCKTIGKK